MDATISTGLIITISTSKKQLREFGLLIGLGFPIFLGWLIPAFAGHGFRVWTLWVGIPALALSAIAPSSLVYPYKAWMKLGHALGWINSHIILGLVFVVVLQPIAIIMSLFGYDPLRKKRGHGTTYREDKKNHHTDLTRIF